MAHGLASFTSRTPVLAHRRAWHHPVAMQGTKGELVMTAHTATTTHDKAEKPRAQDVPKNVHRVCQQTPLYQ
jgi:hypothetical protein